MAKMPRRLASAYVAHFLASKNFILTLTDRGRYGFIRRLPNDWQHACFCTEGDYMKARKAKPRSQASELSRRQFMVRSAAGVAGAAMSSTGFPWGDLAYGQQLKGKPVQFNVAVRPDWTQGWFGVVNEEQQIWKKYLPEGSEVNFSHPIQGGIVTNELIARKTMIGHNGDAPGLIATFQRERADIRAIGLIGSSPTGYHCYQILARTDAPDFKDSMARLWPLLRAVAPTASSRMCCSVKASSRRNISISRSA
jgi:hypothetical protein